MAVETEDQYLTLSVERALKFGEHTNTTITAQGYCPNLCEKRLVTTSVDASEGRNLVDHYCTQCGYKATLSRLTIAMAHIHED